MLCSAGQLQPVSPPDGDDSEGQPIEESVPVKHVAQMKNLLLVKLKSTTLTMQLSAHGVHIA